MAGQLAFFRFIHLTSSRSLWHVFPTLTLSQSSVLFLEVLLIFSSPDVGRSAFDWQVMFYTVYKRLSLQIGSSGSGALGFVRDLGSKNMGDDCGTISNLGLWPLCYVNLHTSMHIHAFHMHTYTALYTQINKCLWFVSTDFVGEVGGCLFSFLVPFELFFLFIPPTQSLTLNQWSF